MAVFNPSPKQDIDFNYGNKFQDGIDTLKAQDVNNLVEGLLSSATKTEVENNSRKIESIMAIQSKSVAEMSVETDEKVSYTNGGGLSVVDGSIATCNMIKGKTVRGTNYFVGASEWENVTITSLKSKKYNLVKKLPSNYVLKISSQDGSGTTIVNNCCSVILYDENNTKLQSLNLSSNNSLNSEVIGTISEDVRNQATQIEISFNFSAYQSATGNSSATISFIMFKDANEGTKYQPYTTELKHSYFKGISSCTKNLLDKNSFKYVDNTICYSAKNIVAGKRYRINANQKVLSVCKISKKMSDSWYIAYGNDYGANAQLSNFPFEMNKPYMRNLRPEEMNIYLRVTENGVVRNVTPEDIEKYEISIILDGADTTYVDYKEDNGFSYSSIQELGEWDYLLPSQNKKVVQTGNITINGGETIALSASTGKYVYAINLMTYGQGLGSATPTEIISNIYKTATVDRFSMNNGEIALGGTSERNYLFIRDDKYTTVEDFKAFLSTLYQNGTPLQIAYKLDTSLATTTYLYPKTSSYFVYNNGAEVIDEEENYNSNYGAVVSNEKDIYVWIEE